MHDTSERKQKGSWRGFLAGYIDSFKASKGATGVCAVLAFAYAILATIGLVYVREHSITGWSVAFGSPMKLAAIFLVQVVVLFIAATFLVYLWDRLALPSKARAEHSERSAAVFPRRFLMYAGLMFLAWLVWIVPHYPGTLRDDTLAQMFQWYGVIDYYTQHPVTDTWIFGVFFSLGDLLGAREAGIFIYILVQAALTALGFSYALCYLEKRRAPKALVWLLFLFYAFARVIYQPIDTMSKDALSAIFFAPIAVLLVEVVRSRGASLKRRRATVALGLLVFCCIVTKRTMLYVFLIAFLVIVVWLIVRKCSWTRCASAFVIPVVCAALVWNPAVNAVANATDNRTFEMYSIPVQQVARTLLNHPDALSEDEYARLGEFLDPEKAVEVYNPWRSDEVNTTEVDDPNTAALVETWVKLGMRHPDTYLAAFLDLTANWYPVVNRITFGHNSYEELQSEARMEAWSNSFFEGDRAAADRFFGEFDLDHPTWAAPLAEAEELVDSALSCVPLFSSFGFYCLFMPILVAVYCILRKNTSGLVALSLSLALSLSFLVGPIALYWYTIPMVYIFPVLVGIPFVLAPKAGTPSEREG